MELHAYKPDISNKCKTKQNEVVLYTQLLKEYKISFSELTNHCPKDPKKRAEAMQVAKVIAENKFLTALIIDKKQLPERELQRFISASHKTIAKYKKYIIALSLIFIGEFSYMREYINV